MTLAQAHEIMWDELYNSGTGHPNDVLTLLYEVLLAKHQDHLAYVHELDHPQPGENRFNAYHDPAPQKRLDELLPSTGLYYFMLYQLDRCGLLLNGFSVGSQGLSEKGKQLLGILQRCEGKWYVLEEEIPEMIEYYGFAEETPYTPDQEK
jgi:hypothetical protein